jgi:hypothetical protein
VDKKQIAWKIVAAGAGMLAGSVMRNVVASAWRAATDSEPPEDPQSPRTDWGTAIAWAAATGAAVGVAELVAQRGAVQGWAQVAGELPPGITA